MCLHSPTTFSSLKIIAGLKPYTCTMISSLTKQFSDTVNLLKFTFSAKDKYLYDDFRQLIYVA